MDIYLDSLLVLNFYISFFIVTAAALFLRQKVTLRRRLLASLGGTALSLSVFLPSVPFAADVLIKLCCCSLVTVMAFGRKRFRSRLFTVIITTALFGGIASLFGEINPLLLICATALSYFVIRLAAKFLDGSFAAEKAYKVNIRFAEGEIAAVGYSDTGNKLLSNGKPVIVVFIDGEKAERILAEPQNRPGNIQISTASGASALMTAIPGNTDINGKSVDAVVAFGKRGEAEQTKAIFNPRILL